MQKHLLYINLIALSSVLALSACSDEVIDVFKQDVTAEEKTPIELSMAGDKGTRAVTINGMGEIRAFEKDTRLFLFMFDQKEGVSSDYEFATLNCIASGKGSEAVPNSKSDINYNGTNCSLRYWDDTRYKREAQVSVYGVAIPGVTTTSSQNFIYNNYSFSNYNQAWFHTNQNVPVYWEWNILETGNKQTMTSVLAGKDLCYTKNQSVDGASDERFGSSGPLKFNTTSSTFDKGNLGFDHALALFEIELWCGAGYDSNSDANFQFADGKNVEMNGFNASGKLDLRTGKWSNQSVTSFSSIYNTDEHTDGTKPGDRTTNNSKPYYTLLAFAVPGTDMKNSTVPNAFDFTIDGNQYKVPMTAIYNAIKAGKYNNATITDWSKFLDPNTATTPENVCIKAGVCYKLKMTVGKTKIENISASLVDWETVVAEETAPDNAYVRLSLKSQTGQIEEGKPKFDFYRAKDPTKYTNGYNYDAWEQYSWEAGYSPADVEYVSDGVYKTSVFWDDNKTFYHFRTVNRGLPVTPATYDYITMYSGPIKDTPKTVGNETQDYEYDFSTATESKYNDYIWGAPFKKATGTPADTDEQEKTPVIPTYSLDYGFCNNETKADGQIYKAIGATKDKIFFYQFHMMSNIYVDIVTTSNTDKVAIDGATVQIVNYAKSANLQMGDAKLVNRVYTGTDATMTPDPASAVTTGDDKHPAYKYSYRVVPQPLKYKKDDEDVKVGVIITTTDGNVYIYEDLYKIKEKGKTSEISEWLPGKKYYYQFTLKKTGIDKIQATIVDWETIEADNQDVQIK